MPKFLKELDSNRKMWYNIIVVKRYHTIKRKRVLNMKEIFKGLKRKNKKEKFMTIYELVICGNSYGYFKSLKKAKEVLKAHLENIKCTCKEIIQYDYTTETEPEVFIYAIKLNMDK